MLIFEENPLDLSMDECQSFYNLLGDLLEQGDPGCVDMRYRKKSLLQIAVEHKSLGAINVLISAGANTDAAFLGEDLFKLVQDNDMAEHIPALTEQLMRRQIAAAEPSTLAPSVTVHTTQDSQASPTKPRLTARDIF